MLNMSKNVCKISMHNGKCTAKDEGCFCVDTLWCQRYNSETQGCAQSKHIAGTITS